MTWTDLSGVFTYASKLTSVQMQQLRDNITALANGDSGAPKITEDAFTNNTIDGAIISNNSLNGDKIVSNSIPSGKLEANSVSLSNMQNNSVDTNELVNSSVTEAKIEDLAVTESKFGSSVISRTKLKTGAGNVSGTITANTELTITMQDYCFFPSIFTSPQAGGAHDMMMVPYDAASDPGNTTGRFGICNTHSVTSEIYAIRYRYVTSSDKPFIYAVQDNKGQITGVWACDDPPEGYWGLNEKPKDFIPPLRYYTIVVSARNDATDIKEIKPHKEHIIFNYPKAEYKEIIDRSKKDKKLIHEMLTDDFEIKKGKKLFTRKNLSQI